MITDHKPLLAIFKKDVSHLSQRFQSELLQMHQSNIRILYKPGSQLFITDWLSRHRHETNRDKEIPGMSVTRL